MAFPSRTTAFIVLAGLTTMIFLGFQNCGLPKYGRTGSSTPPPETVNDCPECTTTAAITVQVTNFRNQVVTENQNTCSGLTPQDVLDGKHRQVTFGLTANFSPEEFQCLRLEPVQDPASPGYVNCSQILTLDRLGTSQCTYETPVSGNSQMAKLICVDLPNTVPEDLDQDTYSTEIVGVGRRSDGLRYRTLPVRPIFQMTDCSEVVAPVRFEIHGVYNPDAGDEVVDNQIPAGAVVWIQITPPQSNVFHVVLEQDTMGPDAQIYCDVQVEGRPAREGKVDVVVEGCPATMGLLPIDSALRARVYVVHDGIEYSAQNSPFSFTTK